MIGPVQRHDDADRARLPRHGLARAWLRAHRRERQAVRRRQGVRRRPLGLLVDPADAQPVHDELQNGSLLAAPHLAQEVLRRATLARCTTSLDAQLMLRGGICGSATKATPESPKSARHTAFQWPRPRSSPRKSAPIFRAVAVTMDSIMKPVLGTPTGTGLAPPAEWRCRRRPRRFRERLVPLLAVHRHETADW